MYLSKHKEYTQPRVNFNVNGGFGVIMMCQSGFMNCSGCWTLIVREAVGKSREHAGI